MRVLILDDVPEIREIILVALRHFHPHLVATEFDNGNDVWDALHRDPTDLLITDNNHPGRSTQDLIALHICPVVVISAGVRESSAPGPRLRILTKPFSLLELRDAVAALVPQR